MEGFSLLQAVKDYFDHTPEEEIARDWSKYNGERYTDTVTVSDYIQATEGIILSREYIASTDSIEDNESNIYADISEKLGWLKWMRSPDRSNLPTFSPSSLRLIPFATSTEGVAS